MDCIFMCPSRVVRLYNQAYATSRNELHLDEKQGHGIRVAVQKNAKAGGWERQTYDSNQAVSLVTTRVIV